MSYDEMKWYEKVQKAVRGSGLQDTPGGMMYTGITYMERLVKEVWEDGYANGYRVGFNRINHGELKK